MRFPWVSSKQYRNYRRRVARNRARRRRASLHSRCRR